MYSYIVEQLVIFFAIFFARNARPWSSHVTRLTSKSASLSSLPFDDPDLQGKAIVFV